MGKCLTSCGTIGKGIALCDLKTATSVIKKSSQWAGLDDEQKSTEELNHFIFKIPEGATMPSLLHVTRDESWMDDKIGPVGHLSIHTMYDDIPWEEYIEQLKKAPFLAHWSVKLTYTLHKVKKGEYFRTDGTGTSYCPCPDPLIAAGYVLATPSPQDSGNVSDADI